MYRWSTVFVVLLLGGWAFSASAEESAEAGDVVVEIANLENQKGVVRCGLYTKSSWLQPEKAVQWVDATYGDEETAECRFEEIEPGTYGVGAFHDADSDHDMDSNFLGIPTESVCASDDPGGRMGPPKFKGAKFRHRRQTTSVPCTMRN